MLKFQKCILDRNASPTADVRFIYKLYLSYDYEEPDGYGNVFSIAIAANFDEKKSIFFNDITRDEETALKVFNTLVNSKVSAYNAFCVIEDLLWGM